MKQSAKTNKLMKQQKKTTKNARPRKKQRSRHFMQMIKKGYRVYDAYFFLDPHITGKTYDNPPAVFSVLSKKPMNRTSMERLIAFESPYVGVVKNIHARDCRYITFDGKTLHRFDRSNGKTWRAGGGNASYKVVAKYKTTSR